MSCPWVPAGDTLYAAYHDQEWGRPVREDSRLFEFLVLEGTQAGLSWRQILARREAYQRAFHGFLPATVAGMDKAELEALLHPRHGLIRNRAKLQSAVSNAQALLQVQKEHGSFAEYLWGFVDGRTEHHAFTCMEQVPAFTPLSERLCADLRRRGFRFVGPTICYAYMQAVGLVNDHLVSCPIHAELLRGAGGKNEAGNAAL